MSDIRDRKRGCLYGLAIGDALGAAVEFRRPGEFPPVIGFRGLGPHGILAGQWTDDTSLALALADSLAQGWDTKDQLTKYLDWFQNGKYSVNGRCFDIGGTTRYALNEFELNGTLLADADEASSGNGSIMRLAPVVIKYCGDPNLFKYLAESSQTTHASPQCTSACVVLGSVLECLMCDASKAEALDFSHEDMTLFHPMIQRIVDGSYKENRTMRGSGWVVESLEAALWAFNSSNSFEETVLKAVNLGDDSDTTGAVAGQLAGAFYGFSGIPQKLIDGLDRKDMIEQYLNPIL